MDLTEGKTKNRKLTFAGREQKPSNKETPHCNSVLTTANSVGKLKLCYAIPWSKTIAGVDMRCGKCSTHFITHYLRYINTLPSDQQIKCDFIFSKGNGSNISLLCFLRLGLMVAQVEWYTGDEVQQHCFMLKTNTLNSGTRYLIPS